MGKRHYRLRPRNVCALGAVARQDTLQRYLVSLYAVRALSEQFSVPCIWREPRCALLGRIAFGAELFDFAVFGRHAAILLEGWLDSGCRGARRGVRPPSFLFS